MVYARSTMVESKYSNSKATTFHRNHANALAFALRRMLNSVYRKCAQDYRNCSNSTMCRFFKIIFVSEDGSFDFLNLEFNFCHQHGAIQMLMTSSHVQELLCGTTKTIDYSGIIVYSVSTRWPVPGFGNHMSVQTMMISAQNSM